MLRAAHALTVSMAVLAVASLLPAGLAGDYNGDSNVDWSDVSSLPECLTGPQQSPPPACTVFDYDADGDTDLVNVSVLQRIYGTTLADPITTIDQLFQFAALGGAAEIAGGTYDLTAKTGGGADLIFSTDVTLVPLGDVTITGAGAHQVRITGGITTATDHSFGDPAGEHRLTFTAGAGATVVVDNDTGPFALTCYACGFNAAAAGNGLSVAAQPAGPTTITLVQPEASYNANDGISLAAGGSDHNIYLYVHDPDVHDNIAASPGGDGITAHDARHHVFVYGGAIYRNGKSGIASVNGAHTFVVGTHFYDNGTATPEIGALYVNDGELVVRNCAFTGGDHPNNAAHHIRVGGRPDWADIDRCYFGDSGPGGVVNSVWIENAVRYSITDCLFVNDTRVPGSYSVSVADFSGMIRSCTFYQCYRAIYLNASRCRIEHCLIVDSAQTGVVIGTEAGADAYGRRPGLGNLFHGNAQDFHDNNAGGSASQLRGTDLTLDPQFVDPASGDLRPGADSPIAFPDGSYWGALPPAAGRR